MNEAVILDDDIYNEMLKYRLSKNKLSFDIWKFLPPFFYKRYENSQEFADQAQIESDEEDTEEWKEINKGEFKS